MPRNIEIKARISSVDQLIRKVAAISHADPIEIVQDDSFFCCARGRLKLREVSAEQGEVIFYRRADQAGPKESSYLRVPTSSPKLMRELLSSACGPTGRVRKKRTLFQLGRTRIHLDKVEGLGDFLELEVVLHEDEPAEAGVIEARKLMTLIGVQATQLVETAYVDLLASVRPPLSAA